MRFEGNWAYLDAEERVITGLPNRVIISNRDHVNRYSQALARLGHLEHVVAQAESFEPQDSIEAEIALERCQERLAIFGELAVQGCVNEFQEYFRKHHRIN